MRRTSVGPEDRAMLSALGGVLPLALGIAASPFPIIPVILLLFTAKGSATSRAFLGGWLLGITTATASFAALAGVLELADQPPTWASWTRIGLGVALLGFGVQQFRSREQATESPGWMQSIASASPVSAARLALLLSLANPKILLLAAAAGLSIGGEELGFGASVVTIGAFTALASISVAAPVLAHAIWGARVLGPLGRAKEWLEANNAVVMAVVFIVLGTLLVVKGFSAL